MGKTRNILRKLIIATVSMLLGIASLNAQTLDAFNPNANAFVSDAEVLSNGKIYAVGLFTTIGGQTRQNFARLNADGTLDTTLADVGIGAGNNITEVIIQSDGKILISGPIFTVTGITRNRIARLNANGSLDTTFDAGFTAPVSVNRIALQSDGKVIVPVSFGTSTWTILRRNADGSADASFASGTFSNVIAQTLVQPDGKVLACGGFVTIDGVTRRGIARFNTNGTLDTTFNANMDTGSCNRMTLMPNGKIYVGGGFGNIGGQARTFFARLNSDGSADATFQTATVAGASNVFAGPAIPLPNGKVIFSGSFDTVGGQARKNIARLNADGSLDSTFRNMQVSTDSANLPAFLTRQPDGKIIVGGGFSTVDGQARNRIARITTDDPIGTIRSKFDFDGDGKTDISIFRPSNGQWWYMKSSNGGNAALTFGSSTDKIVPADYTGDGKADNAFWRPSTGQWFILRSEDLSFFAFPFGANGDTPVPADYDGDGKTDAAVFRVATLTWFIQKSTGGTDILTFGAAGDKPVVDDYDGDGKADIAIYRNNGSVSEWWIRRSSTAAVFVAQFGVSTDKAVQGDYTGDGKADVAFFRPSTSEWFILRSEDSSFYSVPFGTSGDIPSPGDYDGDGKTDTAVFRPSSLVWFIQRSTAGTLISGFGSGGDLSVPNSFVP
jgi:uncharacterized delta-60 repeat protein